MGERHEPNYQGASDNSVNPDKVNSDDTANEDENQCTARASSHTKRWVHYGDPDYFDHLPAHLEHLRILKGTGLPFVGNALGKWTLSYEIEVDNSSRFC